jgi:putative tricarboxylic transport membrane protein
MWEDIAAGFALFATWQTVGLFGLGIAVGIVIGAIPGLSVTLAVSLALPLTFGMDPALAIVFLAGIYKGGTFGGSITAILIRTPGTPAAACTLLDGYPLARQGKAAKALDAALYSSAVADFCSNLALIFLAGLIVLFARQFGPAEYFWLVCFALTTVAAVSGDSLAKGFIAVGIGLLLSTVGRDLFFGSDRLMFGQTELAAGIALIPLLIGLFAVAEVISHYASKRRAREVFDGSGTGLSWPEFRRLLPTVFRGSAIGVGVGAIPGTGGGIASFLSYGEAKRVSRSPETFGKGNIEGVAAAEAGNNGVAGATLIPLLALGVPGDVVTAIMLGAFMVHDIAPGPGLFERHGDIVYAIFFGLALSPIWLLALGKLASRGFTRISRIDPDLLMPGVLLFCVLGSYSVNNSMFDVGLMAVAGLAGFAMLRLDIPPAPLVIAFVLGPLVEDNFRRSVRIGRGRAEYFFEDPMSWVFIALTVLSIFAIVRQRRAQARLARKD